MKRLSALLSSAIVVSSLGLAPAASARECYTGEIAAFPYTFAPGGWLPADGRVMLIVENTALFAALGKSFGGDGKTTFALPNLTGLKPATGPEISFAICARGTWPQRGQ